MTHDSGEFMQDPRNFLGNVRVQRVLSFVCAVLRDRFGPDGRRGLSIAILCYRRPPLSVAMILRQEPHAKSPGFG